MAKQKSRKSYYQKVSRGGKRYINLLNEYNVSKLTEREYFYLSFEMRTRKYNIEANVEEYKKFRKERNVEFMKSMRKSQHELLTGKMFRESINSYYENYKVALQYNGNSDLAKLLDAVYESMTYDERYQFFTIYAPEIPIFYSVKLKAESGKKENQISSLQIDSAMEELAEKLTEIAKDKGLIKDELNED